MKESKNIIEILDDKYKAYLEIDGKWLADGFGNIFVEREASQKNLKTSIYLMLPQEIREYVDQLLTENLS